MAQPLETSPSPRYITVPNLVALNSISVRKTGKAVGTRRLCRRSYVVFSNLVIGSAIVQYRSAFSGPAL